MSESRTFCTVATFSHLPYVYALAETLRSSGNDDPLHVLVADRNHDEAPNNLDKIRFYGIDQFQGAFPDQMQFYFDAFEFSNALKPFLIRLLIQHGFGKVIYLDSDLLCVGSFDPIWNGFHHHSLQMTPHLLAPPSPEETWVDECGIADMGFLNGGFSAWRASESTTAMLDWMCSRLPKLGFCRRQKGMFVDQKLMPLLLQYFPEDVLVRREPGLNIAFWNSNERNVFQDNQGRWMVGEDAVVFFHLSGYRLEHIGKPCSYLPDVTNAAILSNSPWLELVMADYHQRVERYLQNDRRGSYRYGTFNGIPLNTDFRDLLFANHDLKRLSASYWKVVVFNQLRILKHWAGRFIGAVRKMAHP